MVALLLALPLRAQVFYQYFDGADTNSSGSIMVNIPQDTTNVWQIGSPQKTIFDSAGTRPYALVTDTLALYPAGNTSQVYLSVPMWINWGIFALRWKQKLDMVPDHDGGIIEYSLDTGNSWHNVFHDPQLYNFYGFQTSNHDTLLNGANAFSGTDSTWRDIWLCFDMSWLSVWTDSIRFRFTLSSDSLGGGHEGWLIDDMMAHITAVHTVSEFPQEDYIKVYPNPADDGMQIQLRKTNGYHLIEEMELIDASGRVVNKWSKLPVKYYLDTRPYTDGNYVLRIRSNLQTETVKIIIRH